MDSIELARHNMVASQLLPNKVTDEAVIAAFETVDRHLFVPEYKRGLAYMDASIPFGHHRFLVQPTISARLLQLAEIKNTDVVLDIACGTGYSTMVISKLAKKVIGLESDNDLAGEANCLLQQMDVDNAIIMTSDLVEGHADGGPYDVIMINGAVEEIPEDLLKQLADGGRLVTVQVVSGLIKHALLIKKSGKIITKQEGFDAAIDVLPEFVKQEDAA